MIPFAPLISCAAKHRRLRKLTQDALEDEALRAYKLRIDVCGVDAATFAAIGSQWTAPRRVPFQWERDIMPTLEKSHPRRLELSLWCGGNLCGVAVARLSDAKEWLSITHIEGSPLQHQPLKRKVVPLVLAGAQIYATLIQYEDSNGRLPVVRIMNPLPQAMTWYQQNGYSQSHKANGYTYLTR